MYRIIALVFSLIAFSIHSHLLMNSGSTNLTEAPAFTIPVTVGTAVRGCNYLTIFTNALKILLLHLYNYQPQCRIVYHDKMKIYFQIHQL